MKVQNKNKNKKISSTLRFSAWGLEINLAKGTLTGENIYFMKYTKKSFAASPEKSTIKLISYSRAMRS